jgi:hypothetical protein
VAGIRNAREPAEAFGIGGLFGRRRCKLGLLAWIGELGVVADHAEFEGASTIDIVLGSLNGRQIPGGYEDGDALQGAVDGDGFWQFAVHHGSPRPTRASIPSRGPR